MFEKVLILLWVKFVLEVVYTEKVLLVSFQNVYESISLEWQGKEARSNFQPLPVVAYSNANHLSMGSLY